MNAKQTLQRPFAILAICMTLAATVWGQGRGQGTGTPLQHLKQQLAKAGGNALDSNQEAALQSAISAFRNANRPTAPDSAEKAARNEYGNAILAGNVDAAKTAADKLAGLMSEQQQASLKAEAAFSIQALSVLHSDQTAALIASFGNQGLLRILASLAGPGNGLGRGMGRASGSKPAGNPR